MCKKRRHARRESWSSLYLLFPMARHIFRFIWFEWVEHLPCFSLLLFTEIYLTVNSFWLQLRKITKWSIVCMKNVGRVSYVINKANIFKVHCYRCTRDTRSRYWRKTGFIWRSNSLNLTNNYYACNWIQTNEATTNKDHLPKFWNLYLSITECTVGIEIFNVLRYKWQGGYRNCLMLIFKIV